MVAKQTEDKMSDQAQRIADKFGGFPALAKAMGRKDLSALYRWTKPKDKGGTGGFVPTSAVPSVLAAAGRMGIRLTDKDWRP